jgi:hypothetical protein
VYSNAHSVKVEANLLGAPVLLYNLYWSPQIYEVRQHMNMGITLTAYS